MIIIIVIIIVILVNIKAGLKLQLTFRYTTNDQVKNIDIDDITTVIGNFIDKGDIIIIIIIISLSLTHYHYHYHHYKGFKRIVLKTLSFTSELSMKRGKGKFRITRHATTTTPTITTPTITTASATATATTYDHDRKKNVLIDPNEMFLKYLKITTAEGRPKVLT